MKAKVQNNSKDADKIFAGDTLLSLLRSAKKFLKHNPGEYTLKVWRDADDFSTNPFHVENFMIE